MRVINFLPDDYLERRSQRRAMLWCLVLAGSSLLVMGGTTGLVFLRALGAAGVRMVVERQYEEASRQIDQLKQLEQRKEGLLRKVDLSASLLERVPRSHIIARLTNYLPPKTSLTSLTMKMVEVDVKVDASADAAKNAADKPAAKDGADAAKSQPAKTAAASAKKTVSKKAKVATQKVTRVEFRLDGLAPTDVRVAEYIARLSGDPLFEDVDLQFSEEFPYKEGETMRRFQLCFRLSPTAEKVLQQATAADAAPVATAASATKGRT